MSSRSAPSAPDLPSFRLRFARRAVFNFDDDSKADIVLRSSDFKEFSIRGLHLQSASTTFEDVFEVAGVKEDGTKRTADGKEIVRLSENGSMFKMFLQVLYPLIREPASRVY